ncbi:MAG: hypothetical protein J6Z30_01755 [Pyramidobacter sp.]|nr:hypothetical protein [Pyramidobacter sp.]
MKSGWKTPVDKLPIFMIGLSQQEEQIVSKGVAPHEKHSSPQCNVLSTHPRLSVGRREAMYACLSPALTLKEFSVDEQPASLCAFGLYFYKTAV